MGKNIVVPCLDVIMIAVSPRNLWSKTLTVSSEERFCSCKDSRHMHVYLDETTDPEGI